MIEKNMLCSENEPLVKIEIGTNKSIWDIMETVAKIFAVSEKYNGQYIPLEPRELKEGEKIAVEFKLSFSSKKNCRKFVKAAENII